MLALVLVGASATLFTIFSRAARHSQATVDLGNLLRSTAWQLKQDLTGVTCDLQPWAAPETNAGYFELIEGPAQDASYAIDGGGVTANLTADTDDILLFTTQALAEPFVGRFGDAAVESPFAEVAWFCRPLPAAEQIVPGTVLCKLHRRQLLVINYLGDADLANNTLTAPSPGVDRSRYDVSFRQVPGTSTNTALFPNSLGDLTKREHRFLRNGFAELLQSGAWRSLLPRPFPYSVPVEGATAFVDPAATLDDTLRSWEDVMLTNVVAFDVRVYDPDARPLEAGGSWLVPGDPGYAPPAGAGSTAGAYVDLGWGGGSASPLAEAFPPAGLTVFQSRGQCVTGAPRDVVLPAPTYDTWSRHYEFNEIDEDLDGIIDEGTEGEDRDGDGFPEYSGEMETSPPYPVPLRGLEVRIRCYEPVSKQVRQITLRHTFVR